MTAGARALRGAVGVSATTLAGAGMTLVLSVIAARALGPVSKGTYDLMVAASAIAVVAFGLGVPTGVTYAVARSPLVASLVPYPAVVHAAVVGALAALVLAVGAGVGLVPAGSDLAVLLPVSLLAALTIYTLTAESALIGSGRIAAANGTDLVARGLGLIATVLLIPIAAASSFVLAIAAGQGVGAVLQTVLLRPRGWISRATAAVAVKQSIPSYASTVMQLLNYRLDLFIVAFFRGPGEVGLYAVAGTLAQLVWLLPRGAATVLYPMFAGAGDREADPTRVAEASRVAMAVGAISAVALGILAALLIPLFYGSAFADAEVALVLLLPGAVALSPAIVLAAYFLGRGMPGKNLVGSSVGLVITLAADLLLIPALGMRGAAIASSVSYVATLITTLVLAQRLDGTSTRDLLVLQRADVADFVARIRTVLR